MILTCPRCATRYLVEDAEVRPEGRKVRCSSCGEEWRAFIEGAESAVAPPEVVESREEVLSESGGGLEAEVVERTEEAEIAAPVAPESEAWPPLAAAAMVEAVDTELRVAPQEPESEPWVPSAAQGEEPSMVAPIATGRPARRRGGSGAGIVLLVMVFVLAVLVGIFLGARPQLVRAVPAMGGVYKTLGLPIGLHGG
ncbi:MAG TPA: MJ0042-type zinc finger domain-containing protein [Caulobacteraceae bacterium]|nr:MJ0042-type zinc finger domain-containing protein [Caulobacteraceae bacterium]